MSDLKDKINQLVKSRPPLIETPDDLYAQKLERLVLTIPRLVENRYVGLDDYYDILDNLREEILSIIGGK